MSSNYDRALGEEVKVFSTALIKEVKLYKLVGSDLAEELTCEGNSVEVHSGLHYTDVTMPEVDCLVVCVINSEDVVILRAGNPPVEFLTWAPSLKDDEFKRWAADGTLIESGTLTNRGNNIRSFVPTDTNTSILEVDGVGVTFEVRGTTAGVASGTIRLQPNRLQMIAIPVVGKKVKEYFLDKVAELVGDPAETVIKFVRAYPSSSVSSNKSMVFVPGLTNPASSTNFELVQLDDDVEEITPFYVSTKDYSGVIDFDWRNG